MVVGMSRNHSPPHQSPEEETAQVSSTAGLGRALVRGTMWSGANTFGLKLSQFAVSIVIARLVSPRQFGVFVVAATIYLIVVNVSEVGVSTALVREVDNADRIAPTVTTIAVVNSALLAAIMYLSAPALATALGAPAATNAVRVLTIPLLLAGPAAVPTALLTRDFQQGRRLIADSANFILATGTIIVLALNGSGVMALAWSRVAGQAVSCLLMLILAPKRYWPGFNWSEARRLLRFGAPLAGANLTGFTLGNVDFMTVGRLAGPLQLGYYNLAYNVSSWPSNVFTTILSSVTLPALARIRGGMTEVSRHVAAALGALCAVAFPVSGLCIVLAHPLVVTVYGSQWAPAARLLMLLAVFGATRVIIALFSDLLVALGRTRQLFQLQLIWLTELVPAMIVLVYREHAFGAAMAHVLVVLGIVMPTYLLVLARARVPLRVLVMPVGRPLAASGIAGVACWIAINQVSSSWAKLGTGVACFGPLYLTLLGRWLLSLWRELRNLYGPASDGVDARPASALSRLTRMRPDGRHRRPSPYSGWGYSHPKAGHAPETSAPNGPAASTLALPGHRNGQADVGHQQAHQSTASLNLSQGASAEESR